MYIPRQGLITGIIGGIVVGLLSGSPLQVSGPAAGLAVIIWEIVSKYGLPALGLILVVAGLAQVAFGVLKLGRIFRAVSPAVVQGMLSGIGLLILASQFHVMLDDKPKGSGLENLVAIPKILMDVLTLNHDFNHLAALIGLITIAIIILWEKLPLAKLRNAIPPTLISVLAATLLAAVMQLDVKRVELPSNILSAVNWLDLSLIPQLGWVILTQGLVVAFIASAETLLSASAIDKMAPENKAKYDKELIAQGVGNTLCGIVGALPLTGVIVRSSVNVKAGAVSRRSAILHGVWLLLFVVAFPTFLKQIPTAVLAALLVYTGYKLLNFSEIKKIAKQSRTEALILIATMATIVAVDLLTGVLTGIVLSVLKNSLCILQNRYRQRGNERRGNTDTPRRSDLPELTENYRRDRKTRSAYGPTYRLLRAYVHGPRLFGSDKGFRETIQRARWKRNHRMGSRSEEFQEISYASPAGSSITPVGSKLIATTSSLGQHPLIRATS